MHLESSLTRRPRQANNTLDARPIDTSPPGREGTRLMDHRKPIASLGLFLLTGAGLCGAALLLRQLAWRSGFLVNNVGYFGCHFGRLAVGLVALGMVVAALGRLIFPGKDPTGAGWQVSILRGLVAVAACAFSWYHLAFLNGDGSRGLQARFESRVKPEELLAWAGDVLKDVPNDAPPYWHRFLPPEEVPPFVEDMLGTMPGRPTVEIISTGMERRVLITQGSGRCWFAVEVAPPPFHSEYERTWGATAWRPGIYLYIGM